VAFAAHSCRAPGLVGAASDQVRRTPQSKSQALTSFDVVKNSDGKVRHSQITQHKRRPTIEVLPDISVDLRVLKEAATDKKKADKRAGKDSKKSQPGRINSPGTGPRISFKKSPAERRQELEWQLVLLERRKSRIESQTNPVRTSKNNPNLDSPKIASVPLSSDYRPPRTKFVNVQSKCSCGGENENCFKCDGTGIETKRLATTAGCDTTLFSKNAGVVNLAHYANDSRGEPFLVREKGRFDSSPLHDDYDDEATP